MNQNDAYVKAFRSMWEHGRWRLFHLSSEVCRERPPTGMTGGLGTYLGCGWAVDAVLGKLGCLGTSRRFPVQEQVGDAQ